MKISSDEAESKISLGPFETKAFRTAYCLWKPGFKDVSCSIEMDDGSPAFLPLLAYKAFGITIPLGYGAFRSNRSMSQAEIQAAVSTIRHATGLRAITIRSLNTETTQGNAGFTHIREISNDDPLSQFASGGKSNVKVALKNGAEVRVSDNPNQFWQLYSSNSKSWAVSIDENFLAMLFRTGAASSFLTYIDDEAVSGAVVLKGTDHWMYWLGAQSDTGRKIQGSYLAVLELLRSAQANGISLVNLGSSQAQGKLLSGVKNFKQLIGGRQIATDSQTYSPRGTRFLMATAISLKRALKSPRQ